jgi:hypothetical protein
MPIGRNVGDPTFMSDLNPFVEWAGDAVLRWLKRAIRAQDGQARVELALALPILRVVPFGSFDLDAAISDWNSEMSLANVGVRNAPVDVLPNSTQDTTARPEAINVTAAGTMRIENVNSSWGSFSTTC